MRQALYRKYRPKTLAEVVGQDYVKITIGNQLAAGKIGHAYLFAGPKGTGKTTMARILARSVNCLEYNPSFANQLRQGYDGQEATEGGVNTDKKGAPGEPCGKCAMCIAFDKGQVMDLIEIDAASNRSIDSVRELIAKIALAPSQGKYKVYIIDEAQQLLKDASNALLKTLEEPPAHAIFVLATTEPDKLLPTIISRCQRFDFRYVPMKEVEERLARIAKEEKIKISEDGLEFIARQSGGGMRDAESLLEQASFIEGEITQAKLTEWLGAVDWQTVYQLTSWLVGGKMKEIIAKIDELYHQGYDLNRLTASWITITRQILAVKLGNGDRLPVTKEQIKQLAQLAEMLTTERIIGMLQELMWAGREVKSAVVPQAPLEIAVMKLAGEGEARGDEEPPAATGEAGDDAVPIAAPKEIPQQPAAAPQELMDVWPKVLERVRGASPTLAAMLGRAEIALQDGALVVKFTQRFHKEKMEQPGSLGLLRQALQEAELDYRIVCVVSASPAERLVDVQNVSEVFGEI